MTKIPLSRYEIHALIGLILNADYDQITDTHLRELIGYHIRRILRRLQNKLETFPEKKKTAKMGFQPADLSAICKTLRTYDYRFVGIYEKTLIDKITAIIDQITA